MYADFQILYSREHDCPVVFLNGVNHGDDVAAIRGLDRPILVDKRKVGFYGRKAKDIQIGDFRHRLFRKEWKVGDEYTPEQREELDRAFSKFPQSGYAFDSPVVFYHDHEAGALGVYKWKILVGHIRKEKPLGSDEFKFSFEPCVCELTAADRFAIENEINDQLETQREMAEFHEETQRLRGLQK